MEMAPWLNTCCFFRRPKFSSSTQAGALATTFNFSSTVSEALFWPLRTSEHIWHKHTYTHIHIHINMYKICLKLKNNKQGVATYAFNTSIHEEKAHGSL